MAYEADRRVILGHQRLKEQIRQRIESYIVGRWNNLGSWREADVDEFVRQVVPAVELGQRQVAQLTNSYLDSMARLAGVEPSPTQLAAMRYPRGIDPDEAYRRGGTTMWTELANGQSFDDAYAASVRRLRDLVRADLQMANRDAAHSKLSGDERVVGYRRVLSPGENCALCALASTQRYHREQLMPIHSGCRCDVAPIYGAHDPGQVIAEEQLLSLKSAIDEQLGEDGWDRNRPSRNIRVRMHGEHGPVLTWRGQNFTGPDDLS